MSLIPLQSRDGATARIHSQGAHLTQWTPAGETRSRLFLSERAVFAEGVPIRGGVPVIFPQFAALGPLPKHGFARNQLWQLRSQGLVASGEAEAHFTLQHSAASLALWPHHFLAELLLRFDSRALTVQLRVQNTGAEAFQFTAALHSYLAVGDIAQVHLEGLAGLHYRDTASGGVRRQQDEDLLRLTGEVDRNYFDTPPTLQLRDGARLLHIAQQGFVDTVVWNPGAVASAGFKDLAADDYQRFVCIEAASIQQPVTLAPGAQWQGSQSLRPG